MEFVNRKDEPKFKIQIVAPKDAQGLALFRARPLILARKKPKRSEARSSLVAVRQMPCGHLSECALRIAYRRILHRQVRRTPSERPSTKKIPF